MNILWLSWRDIKNPDSGGAEKVAIEVASRFARNGSKVTIFTSKFEGAKESEIVRRVKIIRAGNRLTCRFFAFLYYTKHKNSIDLVVDEINTIPFFSIFYPDVKNIVLMHQLASEYWFSQSPWPLGYIGFIIEPLYLKLYRNIPTVVISSSTKQDLVRLGFRNVKIAQIFINRKLHKFPNRKTDIILFLGRIIPAKKPLDAIVAFKAISEKLKQTHLTIIGRGNPNYIEKLTKLTKDLKLTKRVSLRGYVSEKEKIDVLKKSKVVLIPSIREGWSLVANEAQSFGNVPIAYNVPGLRDSIQNNKTGILVPPNPRSLASATIDILSNESKRMKIAKASFQKDQNRSWENTYYDFKKIIS